MKIGKLTMLATLLLFVMSFTAYADITVDVKMDGIYQKDKIYIGSSGAHPTSVPFTLKDSEATRGNNGYVIGHEEGFYIWSDADGWHARWTGNHAVHVFEGKISGDEILTVTRHAWDSGDDLVTDLTTDDEETDNFFEAGDVKNVQFKTGVSPHEDGLDLTVSSTMGDANLVAPQIRNCSALLKGIQPRWTHAKETADGITTYNVYRATSSTGTYELLGTVNATARKQYAYNDTTGVKGTRYYYRVTAVNASEVESPKSVAVTGKILESPVLSVPTGSITEVPTFTWNAVPDCNKYILTVAKVGGRAIWSIALTDEAQVLSYKYNFNNSTLAELTVGGEYRWVVHAYDRFGSFGVSESMTFTYDGTAATVTGGDAFLRFVNVTHQNNPEGKILTLTANCGNPAKVASVVVTLPTGETKSLTRVGVTRVFAATVSGFSYTAGDYKFDLTTTSGETMSKVDAMDGAELTVPVLSSPTANDTVDMPITFSWGAQSGAKFYRLRIFKAAASGAGTRFINVATTSTSLTIGSECLSANTTYYCRLLAISDIIQTGVDNGARSSLIKFTTGTTGATGGTDTTGGDDNGDGTTEPTGPVNGLYTLFLTTNKLDYFAGQEIVFQGMTIGDGSQLDVYMAIWTPGGKMLFMRRGVEGIYLTEEVLPLVGSWTSTSVTGPIFALSAGSGDFSEPGNYTVYAVFTKPGADVMQSENWVSKLSSYNFVIK